MTPSRTSLQQPDAGLSYVDASSRQVLQTSALTGLGRTLALLGPDAIERVRVMTSTRPLVATDGTAASPRTPA